MSSVAVNPPKTPVTKGSNGIAAATVPNVCKMPGPPAPFVPTPLPNIGQSSKQPDGYSTTVKIEGQPVAIAGATFGSSGDVASRGTGGGIVSNNVEGPTKFVAPGSMNVQIEGKNVQYLGDQMLNNCGPSGSPANAATLAGEVQDPTPAQSACMHENVIIEPDPKSFDHHDKQRPGDGCQDKARAEHAKSQKKLERMEAARESATGERALKLVKDIADHKSNMDGQEWEVLVAADTDPVAMNITMKCASCKLVLGEFDLLLEDGRVKECKASWRAMSEKKFANQINLVEKRQLLGPGKVMHFAIPKGARERLDTKFSNLGKDTMRGRIQEH